MSFTRNLAFSILDSLNCRKSERERERKREMRECEPYVSISFYFRPFYKYTVNELNEYLPCGLHPNCTLNFNTIYNDVFVDFLSLESLDTLIGTAISIDLTVTLIIIMSHVWEALTFLFIFLFTLALALLFRTFQHEKNILNVQ